MDELLETSADTVVVTGSRAWEDAALIGRVLAALNPKLVVQGGAKGADRIAFEWAVTNNVSGHTMPAFWDQDGKRAGSLRNIRMLEMYPGALVVGFPLDRSIGTYHCMREARKRGHKVMHVHTSGMWTLYTPSRLSRP